MAAGTLIYYRGYAVNAIGTGYSSDGSFWTVPDAPAVGAATAVGSASFDANWSAATGATNYLLDAATDAGFTAFVAGYQDRLVGTVTSYGGDRAFPVCDLLLSPARPERRRDQHEFGHLCDEYVGGGGVGHHGRRNRHQRDDGHGGRKCHCGRRRVP
jgi:hypothetical protein